MAGNFNKVILLGRLTRDPETRFTGNNMAITKVGLAITRRWKAADGQIKEEPTYIDCDAFGKTAENIGKFFSKGKPIFIEGHLRLDQWQDKTSGENRSKLKVVIDTFQFVESRTGGGAGGPASGGMDADVSSGGYDEMDQQPPAPAQAPGRPGSARVVTRPSAPQPQEMTEDDIPF